MNIEKLREVLAYNPETGELFNKGRRVGTRTQTGYLQTKVFGTLFLQHRLIWLLQTGNLPRGQVDHINGVKHDNRWGNLRDVEQSTNMQNQRRPNRTNTSGFMGIAFEPDRNKYKACLKVNGKHLNLGRFDTPEEAHLAYIEAKRKHHPGFIGMEEA